MTVEKLDLSEKKKNQLKLIIFVTASIVAFIFIVSMRNKVHVNNEIESLQNAVGVVTETVTEEKTPAVSTENATVAIEKTTESATIETEVAKDMSIDWADLKKKYPNLYAWIYIPDTDINYPIFQHPTDNEYYLRHNMDGSLGHPGCLYTEKCNNKDFSDRNTVVYGHTLPEKDIASMFTTLHKFEDTSFFAKDHYIYVYTEENNYTYEVFAAYEYPAYHLIENFDYSNDEVYASYIDSIYHNTEGKIKNIKNDIEVGIDDKLLTLSTCTYDYDDLLRYLVAGVLVENEEMPGIEESTVVEESTSVEEPKTIEEPTSVVGEKVKLVVGSGMDSFDIAMAAESAGLVEDAVAFNRYMVEKKYDEKLVTGTFYIPVGSDMETIARILMGM